MPLLQDLLCAAIHSRAAYGYAMEAGHLASVSNFAMFQTVRCKSCEQNSFTPFWMHIRLLRGVYRLARAVLRQSCHPYSCAPHVMATVYNAGAGSRYTNSNSMLVAAPALRPIPRQCAV